jgi:5'-deoxynucleotidase YfbR-like HD superfamily hydrolase
MENLFTPNHIRVFSGKYINPLEPALHLIDIEDIAHSLSMQCRFGGHTKVFYSVAEHCINVCQMVAPGHELAGLLHDAAEAYLLDIPSPVKANLSEYKGIEDRLMTVISEKFGFKYPLHREVKQCDAIALKDEWESVVLSSPSSVLTQSEAKSLFLELFYSHSTK